MTSVLVRLRLIVMAAGMSVSPAGELCAESPGDETLVIRLVHPERQAAEVLSLFEGSPAPHPAAALAAWKRATRDPDRLGKPLEAVIALFNPEMAREWGVLHEAELRLDFSAAGGKPRWYAVVPRDDGTVAAAVTAQRLTDGGPEPPLGEKGSGSGVERLGPPGSTVATQIGDTLFLGSSRDELMRHSVECEAKPCAPVDQPGKSRGIGRRWRFGPARFGSALRSRPEAVHGARGRCTGVASRHPALSRAGMPPVAREPGPQGRTTGAGGDDAPRSRSPNATARGLDWPLSSPAGSRRCRRRA